MKLDANIEKLTAFELALQTLGTGQVGVFSSGFRGALFRGRPLPALILDKASKTQQRPLGIVTVFGQIRR